MFYVAIGCIYPVNNILMELTLQAQYYVAEIMVDNFRLSQS